MANSRSVLKRVRKSRKSRMRNREMKSKVKNAHKNLRLLFEKEGEEAGGKDLEKVWLGVRRYVSLLDKMVKKKLYHKNKAGRKKSQCMKKYHFLKVKREGIEDEVK